MSSSVRRRPLRATFAAFAITAASLTTAACGEDAVEQNVEEGVEDVEQGVEEGGQEMEEETEDEG